MTALLLGGTAMCEDVADHIEKATGAPYEVVIIAVPSAGGRPQIMTSMGLRNTMSLMHHCAHGVVSVFQDDTATKPRKDV